MSELITRPDKLPEWVPTYTSAEWVEEPPQAKRDTGFVGERPPAKWWNWIESNQSLWIKYFDSVQNYNRVFYVDVAGTGQFDNIPAALAALPTGGGDIPTKDNPFFLYVRKGTYVLGTGDCDLPNGVFLVGESRNQTILEGSVSFSQVAGFINVTIKRDVFTATSGFALMSITDSSGTHPFDEGEGVIENCNFEINMVETKSSYYFIWGQQLRRLSIRNCRFRWTSEVVQVAKFLFRFSNTKAYETRFDNCSVSVYDMDNLGVGSFIISAGDAANTDPIPDLLVFWLNCSYTLDVYNTGKIDFIRLVNSAGYDPGIIENGGAGGGGGLTNVHIDHTFSGQFINGNNYIVDLTGATADLQVPCVAPTATTKIGLTVIGVLDQVGYGDTHDGYHLVLQSSGYTYNDSDVAYDTYRIGQNATSTLLSGNDGAFYTSTPYDIYFGGDLSGDWETEGSHTVKGGVKISDGTLVTKKYIGTYTPSITSNAGSVISSVVLKKATYTLENDTLRVFIRAVWYNSAVSGTQVILITLPPGLAQSTADDTSAAGVWNSLSTVYNQGIIRGTTGGTNRVVGERIVDSATASDDQENTIILEVKVSGTPT